MFFLEGDDIFFVLVKNKVYTVGRITGDIVIKDSSISRKHAEIRIQNEKAYLRDCNSKYFSKYKGRILLVNEEIELDKNGQITFGEVTLNFRMDEPIVTCSTGLKENEAELKTNIDKLGGTYLKDWNDTCTHLTTPEIIITLKIIYAIMDNKKIVTPQFWKVFIDNINNKKLPPDPQDYTPQLGEIMIDTKYIEYNPARKLLFNNKIFAFWKKKQQSKMNTVIKKAGGESVLISDKNNLEKYINRYIFVDPEDATIETQYQKFYKTYKEKGKRLIPVQEIVLAVLHCSCDEHCNPDFDRVGIVFGKESQIKGRSKLLVEETPTQQFSEDYKPDFIIPSSFEESVSVSTSKKNLHSIDDSQLSAKRIKLDPEITITETVLQEPVIQLEHSEPSTSRKRPINENFFPPPKKFKEQEVIKNNPFASMISSSKIETNSSKIKDDLDLDKNPFKDLNHRFTRSNVKNENQQDNVDNEVKIIKTKRPQIKKQVEKKQKMTKHTTFSEMDFSKIEYDISIGRWLDSTIKEEIKPSINILNNNDEEKKWCEQFDKSITVKMENLIIKNKENIQEDIKPNLGRKNVVNFKKFRKTPVMRSKVIVTCEKGITCPSNLDIDYGFSEDEDVDNF